MAFVSCFTSYAQISDADYVKAGWMTARMYGGNRSGYGPNWLVMTYNRGYDFVKDADGSYDLTGGWHDCGDHVKFGQTQFYAGYMLLLGYDAFPEGYDDFYSFDYSGYESSGDFSFEGKKGTPNGIPDILDEAKYATDYFIKCTRDGSTFYSQVGNGDNDHKNWVTSVTMAGLSNDQGGESGGSRVIKKNPNDASMPSFAGAALAIMSRVYRPFDAAYADLCLQHAKYAYQYAAAHPTNSGGGTITGSFYGADNKWEDNFVCLTAELYWATGDDSYKTEALNYAGNISDHGWVLDYENSDDLAAYELARLGNASGLAELNSMCNRYKNSANASDVMEIGSSWGRLRYTASACFVLALQHSLNQDGNIHSALQGSIDYMLGNNSSNQSFIVGFGSKSPNYPHHRNVFMNDYSGHTIPTKNKQHGYLVGGTFSPSTFPDDIGDYQTSEGGIDYNAGLVGALGYINSIKSPVDQSKFGLFACSKPDLGADVSLCGMGTITLDAQLSTTNRTFSWELNDNPITSTSSTLTVSSGGTYKVTVDSSGCISSDVIVISDVIPTINLGNDKVISGSTTLNTAVTGSGLSFNWTKDGALLPSNTTSITVTEAGTYAVTVSGSGCTSKTDEIILSLPPAIVQTSQNITIDGIAEAAYTNPTSLDIQLLGTPTASDLSANWSALWDNTNVYVFISVTDNDKVNDSGTAWYEDDGIELFIDGKNNKATAYDNDDFQWGFRYNDANLIDGGNNVSPSNGIVFNMVNTTNGYDLEVSIPWTTIGITPSVGTVIGFDVAINDDDGGTDRENKISWNATADQGWQDPSFFGETELIEEPVIVTPPTQTINISSGWNLISFNVLPTDASMATVFNNSNIEMVKSDNGFFKTSQPSAFNSISEIELGKGYLVYATGSTTINLEGTRNETMNSNLKQGWNLIGVPASTNIGVSSKTSGTNIQTVKDFNGAYIVGGSNNSITEFIPGKAYFIYSTNNTTLDW